VPASLPGRAVLAWERVEVCGPRLISGLVGPVAQTKHAGWPGRILYTYCTRCNIENSIYIYIYICVCFLFEFEFFYEKYTVEAVLD